MKEKINYEKQLKNLADELAESVLLMSDSEVKEEVMFLGENLSSSARKIRNLIQNIIKKYYKLRESEHRPE
jgi:hypothetical protein